MDLYNASNVDEEEDAMAMTPEEYESNKAELQRIIEASGAAVRLAQNEDFKALVMDGYFSEHPKRLGCLIASGKLPQSGIEGSMKELEAVASFRKYLQQYIDQGNAARDELAALEAAYQEFLETAASE